MTSASNEYGVNSDGIESRSHSTLKWYKRTKLGSLLPFFQRTFVFISYLNDVPIFSFSWTYWFGFQMWIEQSIDLYIVHYSEIFSWRRESTTLSATTESLLVWGKTCSASLVLGGRSGRHSRLGLRYPHYIHSITWSFFHTINQMMFVRMFVRKKFRIVLDDGWFFRMTAGTRIKDSFKKMIFSFKTSWKPLFGGIRVYRLPRNHCRSRETDPGFEFPASNYPWNHRNLPQLVCFSAMFFWSGDRQTNKQTDRQTFIS